MLHLKNLVLLYVQLVNVKKGHGVARNMQEMNVVYMVRKNICRLIIKSIDILSPTNCAVANGRIIIQCIPETAIFHHF